MFCPFCGEDRAVRMEMRGMGHPTRTCDRGHVLPEDAPASPPVAAAVTPAKLTSIRSAPIVNLAKAIRDRKRDLRRTIREASRELAQLERLGAPPKRQASVTPIKRGASS